MNITQSVFSASVVAVRGLLVAVFLTLTAGIVPVAVAQANPSSAVAPTGQPPVAKKATDRRTQHYQRRRECEALADQQSLQGDEATAFVQHCLVN